MTSQSRECHCASCAGTIEKAIRKVSGVKTCGLILRLSTRAWKHLPDVPGRKSCQAIFKSGYEVAARETAARRAAAGKSLEWTPALHPACFKSLAPLKGVVSKELT